MLAGELDFDGPELEGDDGQALALEATDDLPDQAAFDRIGLAEDEGAGAHGAVKLAGSPRRPSIDEQGAGRAHHIERAGDHDLAVGWCGLDGERHRVLSTLLKRSDWNVETLREVAKGAAHMSSDGEKAGVLVAMADAAAKDPASEEALVNAANSISSDGEHTRVLMAALNGPRE